VLMGNSDPRPKNKVSVSVFDLDFPKRSSDAAATSSFRSAFALPPFFSCFLPGEINQAGVESRVSQSSSQRYDQSLGSRARVRYHIIIYTTVPGGGLTTREAGGLRAFRYRPRTRAWKFQIERFKFGHPALYIRPSFFGLRISAHPPHRHG